MQKNILQKCLDELNKEPFKIDKVIGMLETLIEMDGGTTYPIQQYQSQPFPNNIGTNPYLATTPVTGSGLVGELTPEELIAQRYAGGPVGNF